MSLGALFSHLSGLYFTGKLAYARAFAQPPAALAGRGTYVLTFTHGLLDPDTPVDPEMLWQFRRAGEHDPGTVAREPLVASARELGRRLGEPHCDVVLLGSVQSSKYTEALEPVFGERLRIPRELVRRGHLQRGGLLLECAASGQELEYVGLDELRVMLASGRRRR